MIRNEYFNQTVAITDVDGRMWIGKVEMITSAADSDSGENELAVFHNGGLLLFRESEIKAIELHHQPESTRYEKELRYGRNQRI